MVTLGETMDVTCQEFEALRVAGERAERGLLERG
jgi:hypothetical protein